MRALRRHLPISVVVLCLTLMIAGPAAAAPGGNGNGTGHGGANGNGGTSNPPNVAATPELDSLMLFGAGAAGMAGYVLMRVRAGRRENKDTD